MWLKKDGSFNSPARYQAMFVPANPECSLGDIYLGCSEDMRQSMNFKDASHLVLRQGILFEDGKKVAVLMPYAIGLNSHINYSF